jgi:hypothetical protein
MKTENAIKELKLRLMKVKEVIESSHEETPYKLILIGRCDGYIEAIRLLEEEK